MPEPIESYEIVIDENVERVAGKMVESLITEMGTGPATAIVVSACSQALSALLHLKSPMWEMNQQAVAVLLANLTGNVMAHRDCAARINGGPTGPVH